MANKSKNVSFRYDIERFEFIKSKEKLDSNQKVFDFLVNKYWWEHKIAAPTHKDVPMAERTVVQNLNIQPETNYAINTTPPPIPITLYATFYNRLGKCATVPEVVAVIAEVEANKDLTWPEKKQLREFGQEVTKTMYND